MKIKEILKESPTGLVARFYKEASASTDRFFNLEIKKYKEKNTKYYESHFGEWYESDVVPVFEKPAHKSQPEYRPKPAGSELQSPGYRGLQYALAAAGLPYNHGVQKYNPAAPAVTSAEMDACRNNNGN